MPSIRSYLIFVKERFSPIEVTLLLFMESITGFMIGVKSSNLSSVNWFQFSMIFVVLWLFFLQLRIFDDIKDFEVDRDVHPNRPLSRGLMSISDLQYFLYIIIIIQILLVFYLQVKTNYEVLLFYSCAFLLSVLMRFEFFVKNWIKQHIFVYLVTHQLVVPFIMILPYLVAVSSIDVSNLIIIYLTRVIVGNFLIELIRKTVGVEQEREGFETYSSNEVLGYKGATILILILSSIELIPVIVFKYYPSIYWNVLFFGSYLLFLTSMFLYFLKPNEVNSKRNLTLYGLHLIIGLALILWDVI